jgi:pimeloyl-ACP methyl ester carboxylesterase
MGDSMTFALIHGAGDAGWYWHLVEAELQARGFGTVAPDLPIEDDSAGLSEYAEAVIEAIGDRHYVAVVAQSFGGYVAPIVAERLGSRARLIVLVAGMLPKPGERPDDYFANTRYRSQPGGDDSEIGVFYQDVPEPLAEEALRHGRRQSDTPGRKPWPLAAWPDTPTHFVLCRDDRFFPAAWLRGIVRERLGIEPDEIDSGHTPALSHPRELGELLAGYAAYAGDVGGGEGGTSGPGSPPPAAISRRGR